MRTAIILLFTCVFISVAETGHSQNAKVSLNKNNVNLKEVLNEIENQTDYLFIYNNEVNTNKTVSVNTKNRTVREVLNHVLRDSNIDFSMEGNHIILSYIEKQLKEIEEKTEIVQQKGKTITGTIVDAQGETIIGANIIEKGTSNGTITDFDGNFTLQVGDNAVLRISYIGYLEQEVSTEGKSSINITLMEDTKTLDELVVMGYGTQSRRKVTSSISSVKMDNIDEIPTSSISQSLSGKAAGLGVNLQSAQPGGGVAFQIRGSATGRSPLIVIDGMPTSDFTPAGAGVFGTGSIDATLSSLNPADIKSIDILKDASATAIYGSKAAGGVILITTKSGEKSDKSSFGVKLNMSTGVQQIYNLPDMLSASDYMVETNRVRREKWLYDSREGIYSNVPKGDGWTAPGAYSPYYSDLTIQDFKTGKRVGTDFVDEVTRSGAVQDINLAVNGNTKNTRFYSSFSVYDQKGVIKNNQLSKYNGRINVDQDFGDKLTGGLTFNFSQINSDNVPIGNGGLFENSGILLSALQFDPTLPVFDENGEYQSNIRQSNFPNPVSFLEISNETTVERIFNTANLKYNILPELYVKAQVGFDRTQSRSYGYLPTSTISGKSYNARADRSDNMNTNYQFQLLANYIKSVGNHNFTGLLGTEYMKYNWEGLGVTATNFPYDGVKWNNLGLGANRPSVWSNGGSTETASYFTQLSYDYDYKYFVSANFRIDGSANFSPDDQYGFFPGISVGWDISRESFMKSSEKWLDQLKLRAGYGETGNDNIGSAFSDWYAPGANTMWGNSVISGVRLDGLGNPNLKWEKQVDINVGLDFSLFQNRITGSVEYFNRVISRILGQRNLISSNPVNTIAYNLDAEKQTYGAEVTINTRNIETKDFSWNSMLTYTYYRDRWLKRDPSYVLGINETTKQYFGELWYYETDGLVQVGSTDALNPIPGTIKIKDVNGYLLDNDGNRVVDANGKPQYSGKPDGEIDAADLVKVGINTPFTIGFNNTMKYKKFDLAIDTYGVFNRWKVNSTRTTLAGPGVGSIISVGSNLMEEVKDRWNSDNQVGDKVSSLQSITKYGVGDYYLEKAWFIRVRNITLGYTLPNHISEKAKMNNLRIFANVMNPFLFTPYTGMDPETDQYVAAYPNQRTFSLGVQIGF